MLLTPLSLLPFLLPSFSPLLSPFLPRSSPFLPRSQSYISIPTSGGTIITQNILSIKTATQHYGLTVVDGVKNGDKGSEMAADFSELYNIVSNATKTSQLLSNSTTHVNDSKSPHMNDNHNSAGTRMTARRSSINAEMFNSDALHVQLSTCPQASKNQISKYLTSASGTAPVNGVKILSRRGSKNLSISSKDSSDSDKLDRFGHSSQESPTAASLSSR